jgi:tRNA(His) guanylyltransferase
MKQKDLDTRMRDLEYFSTIRLVPGTWTVIRVDGRGFSKFTADRFQKPYDARFRDLMIVAAQALIEDLDGVYASTHSDEISVLFRPAWELFGRRMEKIVSVSAGLASAAFTHACGEPAHFDSRVWCGLSVEDVVDYFRWRQDDAARCALHGWCYWTLRGKGMDASEASHALIGKDASFQNELLFREGTNFNDVPIWQRRGVALYWEEYTKQGFNPVKAESVLATRRQVQLEFELPMGEAYADFVRSKL